MTTQVEYIPGGRLRHTDGSEANVTAVARSDDWVVEVETDAGYAEKWPRDEIAGFGSISFDAALGEGRH